MKHPSRPGALAAGLALSLTLPVATAAAAPPGTPQEVRAALAALRRAIEATADPPGPAAQAATTRGDIARRFDWAAAEVEEAFGATAAARFRAAGRRADGILTRRLGEARAEALKAATFRWLHRRYVSPN